MTFEKTKAVEHTEDEGQEDLKDEEDTSTDAGQSEENDTGAEEDTSTNEAEEADATEEEEKVTLSKAEYDKVVKERDNYKQGMLSAKAKKRILQTTEDDQPKVDLNEKVVMGVLEKQSEKTALKNTIDPKHGDYIPELVDDANYQEIIAYLPRNMDKGDYGSIVKSLKVATRMWKEDKGIKEEKPAKVNIPSSKTTSAGTSKVVKKKGRTFFKKSAGMESWYGSK